MSHPQVCSSREIQFREKNNVQQPQQEQQEQQHRAYGLSVSVTLLGHYRQQKKSQDRMPGNMGNCEQ